MNRRALFWSGVFCLACALALAVALLLNGVGPSRLPLPAPTQPNGAATDTPVPAHETFTVTLPLVTDAYTTTHGPSLPVILDCDGQVTNTAWLRVTFGAVTWSGVPTDTARLAAIWACCGDCAAVIVAHVETTTGQPLAGVPVVFYWPQAPMLALEMRGCGLERGIVGTTNERGDVGFGLGRGSYYWPPDGGPHTLWIGGTKSDCISGLGMLGATDHAHLDVGWVIAP